MLTRVNTGRLVAAACVAALGLLPAAQAHASTTTGERIAATTQAIDASAQRWYAAQAEASRLDAGIADVQRRIRATQANVDHLRRLATARAVVMYQNANVGMSTIFGDNALDSARREHLVDDANAGGDEVIAQLVASVGDLDGQRRSLEQQRVQQQQVLAEVASQRGALDAELEVARAQARRDAEAALARAHDRASRMRARTHLRALTVVRHPDLLAAPTGAPLAAPPVRYVAPPNLGRVSPHHDDPFLVCTRARESSGRYDAVSPSGYYGAYQFLPSTWDSTAVHASRRDLVGVLPSRASEYDQDELAWALYTWQGNAPWGGRC